MLAKANRVLSGNDFRQAVRRGRRATSPHAVVYSHPRGADSPTRFGFIVTKAVGGAVVRNTVRRRLRAVSRDILSTGVAPGTDVVVRVLPGMPELDWATLQTEVTEAVHRSVGRQ